MLCVGVWTPTLDFSRVCAQPVPGDVLVWTRLLTANTYSCVLSLQFQCVCLRIWQFVDVGVKSAAAARASDNPRVLGTKVAVFKHRVLAQRLSCLCRALYDGSVHFFVDFFLAFLLLWSVFFFWFYSLMMMTMLQLQSLLLLMNILIRFINRFWAKSNMCRCARASYCKSVGYHSNT